jgi:hypothetical protein
MKIGIKLQGANLLLNKYRAYPEALARTVESVVVQQARSLCGEFGAATMPGPGFDEAKAEKFRGRVFSEVSQVFAIRAKPSQVYQLMKIHAPHLANAYWHAYRSKRPRAMAEILRKANLPQGLDPSAHKAARTGKHGGVKISAPASLANEAQFRVFARKQRALVGFAKAGWLCAAKGLGGRVRRGSVADDGRRNSAEIFPKYVRDLARKFPGAGGSRIKVEGSRVTVEIFTNVKHARNALPDNLLETCVDRAASRTAASLTIALQDLNRRTFAA